MPRNSSGTYSLPAGNPVVSGTTITVTWGNTTLADIGDALTDSLSRSGDGGMTAPLELDNGAVGVPSLTFTADPDTGLYWRLSGDMGFTCNGVLKFIVNTTTIAALVPVNASDGTVGAPSYSFNDDTNTGFYRTTADQIAISLGGVSGGEIAQGSFTGTLTGMSGSTTGTINWQRVGKGVTAWSAANLLGTSNTTAMTMTGWPAAITPSFNQWVPVVVVDNGADWSGWAQVRTDNTIVFAMEDEVSGRVALNTSLFTNSGSKGLNAGWKVFFII